MSAEILDGRSLAASLKAELTAEIEALRLADAPPSLVSLQIGESEPSRAYIQSQRKACAELGILYSHTSLDPSCSERQLVAHVRGICANPEVTGLIVQLPMPERLDPRVAYRAMDPRKDVEGMHPSNLGALLLGEGGMEPCTAVAVLALVRASGVPLRGADVCVVGHSDVVGKPIAMLLLHDDATVTTCHVHTRDLVAKTRVADVLVVAAGKPGLIGPEHVKPGACVVDVGINYLEGRDRPVGDVRPEVAEVAGWLTPVPGGVGPVTVAILLRNTVRAARAQAAGRIAAASGGAHGASR